MEKVLLLNFSEAECERLKKNTGLVVHRGYIDPSPGYISERDGSTPTAPPHYFSPDSLYEYAAIFMNLHKPSAHKDEFSDRLKLWQNRDTTNFLRYWYRNGGFVIVFLGDSSYGSLRVIGIPADLATANDTDKTCELWRISDYDTDFRTFLSGLKKKVKMPGSHYIKFDDKLLDNHEPSVRRFLANTNGDILGGYVDRLSRYADNDQPMCMLLPQFKDNIEVVEGLITEVDKVTSIFPSLKSNSWKSSDEYLPSDVQAFESQIEDLRVKFKTNLEKLRAQQDVLRDNYKHLVGLLTNQDDDLVADVEWALHDILKIPVTNSDTVMKSRIRKEDLVLQLNKKTILSEVKGTVSQNPSPAYVSQLLTHVALNKKPGAEINGCMLILNYDLEKQPHKRPLAYTGELEGLLDGITFLDTRTLHAIVIDVLEGKLKSVDAVKLLDKLGRVTYPK